MGFFDSKKTKTKVTNTSLETGMQISGTGNQALSAQGDNNKIFNVTTDLGAIDGAFDLAGDALSYGAAANRNVVTASENALTFAGGTLSKAIGAITGTVSDAFSFSAGAMQASLDQAEKARDSAERQVSRAIGDTRAIASDSINAIRQSSVDTLTYSAGAFQTAIDGIENANLASSAAYGDALEVVSESVKSESEAATEKVTKVALWAVVAAVAVAVLPPLFKRMTA